MREYIILNGKQPIHKFKNPSDRKTWEEVKNEKDVARIIPEPFIVLDFDTKSDSEIMLEIIEREGLKCSVMKTTRGIHCYFRSEEPWKNFTKARLACGLYCDCKSHSRNSYTVIRQNGKNRQWIQKYPADETDPIPKYLYPVSAPERFSFKDMGEGDGRNQELYNYIPFLRSKGFSKNEIRETIRVINDCVLGEALPDKEINAILRDESFDEDPKQSFFQGKTLLHNKVGDYLINEYHISRLEGTIIVYQHGAYIESRTMDFIETLLYKMIPTISDRQVIQVKKYIRAVAPNVTLSSPAYIAFDNGVYDLERGELMEPSPKYVILNKIPWVYSEDAYSQTMDETLDRISCDDGSIRALIEEMIGYCFYRDNVFRKCFVLVGEKRNGKSTLLGVLEAILGEENISALDLRNLGDRFSKAQLFRKLANIGDDISDEFISDPSLFKKIVSGNRIEAEFKGQTPFSFNPYCKLIFSTNGIPRIKDDSGAVCDRLITIPFDAIFSPSDPGYDPHIKEKLLQRESIEYLIHLGMEGLRRVLRNKGFTKSEKVETELQSYQRYNNPIIGFFEEHEENFIFEHSRRSIYLMYKNYCEESGIRAESNHRFYKNVVRLFNVESKQTTLNGVKGWYFVVKI